MIRDSSVFLDFFLFFVVVYSTKLTSHNLLHIFMYIYFLLELKTFCFSSSKLTHRNVIRRAQFSAKLVTLMFFKGFQLFEVEWQMMPVVGSCV